MPLPGDDLASGKISTSTRALTIKASPSQTWPWIKQIGHGRGGFYSYTWLENLFGYRGKTINELIPDWDAIQEGDQVKFAANGIPVIRLSRMVEGRTFVLTHDSSATLKATGGRQPLMGLNDFIWQMHLEPVGDGGDQAEECRLIVRSMISLPQSWFMKILDYAFSEFGHFIMEQKMMRGIRDRAEKAIRN